MLDQQLRSDAALISASLTDAPVFAAVFDRHWPAIHRWCVSRAGPAGGGPRRRGAPRKAPLYALAVVVFAVAIVVAAGALPSGEGPAPRIARRIGVPAPAEAALVKLSQRIQSAPAPSGDATLVLRSHDFPTAKDFTGADLYLDDGRYFYGTTLAELRANAKHGDSR